MKCSFQYFVFVSLLFIFSCTTHKEFIKENVCSPNAMAYINGSKGKSLRVPRSSELRAKLEETQIDIQSCYKQYMKRTGLSEFQTCLVVGVDSTGRMEYYNFSSQDIHSDQAFIQCAVKVTKQVPFWKYGKNFILLQTYNFY